MTVSNSDEEVRRIRVVTRKMLVLNQAASVPVACDPVARDLTFLEIDNSLGNLRGMVGNSLRYSVLC